MLPLYIHLSLVQGSEKTKPDWNRVHSILTPHWWRPRCHRRGRSGWSPAGWRWGTGAVGTWRWRTLRTTHTAAPSQRERAQRPAGRLPARSHLQTHTHPVTLKQAKAVFFLLQISSRIYRWIEAKAQNRLKIEEKNILHSLYLQPEVCPCADPWWGRSRERRARHRAVW